MNLVANHARRIRPADPGSARMTRPVATYVFRGSVERVRSRGQGRVGTYVWHDGYSEDAPGGGVSYPWMTKRECQRDARERGCRAVFVRKES